MPEIEYGSTIFPEEISDKLTVHFLNTPTLGVSALETILRRNYPPKSQAEPTPEE